MKLHLNRYLKYFNIRVEKIKPFDAEIEFLSHLSDELQARQLLLEYHGITALLDVGANSGQYASLMRRIGYKGRIVSFEPLSTAYSELKNKTALDAHWQDLNFALGSKDEEAIIHVSGNSYSSSILDILPSHIEFDADSKYISEERIQVKRLDDVYDQFVTAKDIVMLKIDTQGFEKNVLMGAKDSLSRITLLQLEISIEPLYNNEILFLEMITYLNECGFELFTLENGIRNPKNGKLLQVDGIFKNRNL